MTTPLSRDVHEIVARRLLREDRANVARLLPEATRIVASHSRGKPGDARYLAMAARAEIHALTSRPASEVVRPADVLANRRRLDEQRRRLHPVDDDEF